MFNWTPTQRNVAFASFASWARLTLFILVFVLSDLASYFHNSIADVSLAIMLTLAVRPLGALLFSRLAEKYGRRPILMLNIVLFSLLSAWSSTFGAFLALRIIYGVAMGGIWGVASSLAMETIPDRSRGLMSSIFLAGLPVRLSAGLGSFWAPFRRGGLARHVSHRRAADPAAAVYLFQSA
nr:Pyrimidine-specific ribonucleoside hydrolase RihA [Candidatus Pantoea persica]